MRRLVGGLVLGVVMFGGAAVPAFADLGKPPVTDAGHIHHVDTPAGCVSIDAVEWLGGVDNGLHQGANASTSANGPWHGACP